MFVSLAIVIGDVTVKSTPVISPVLVVNQLSLLNAESGISDINFLLSAPLSNRIN